MGNVKILPINKQTRYTSKKTKFNFKSQQRQEVGEGFVDYSQAPVQLVPHGQGGGRISTVRDIMAHALWGSGMLTWD